MKSNPEILIHSALYHEAAPIIGALNLKQYETRPFRVFRGAGILLVVSGVGMANTRNALHSVLKDNSFTRAINVGLAGCTNPKILIGTLIHAYVQISGRLSASATPLNAERDGSVPQLITLEAPRGDLERQAAYQAQSSPSVYSPVKDTEIVDMEAAAFVESVSASLKNHRIHVLKVISDHLDDSIPSSSRIQRLIASTLPRWKYLLDGQADKIDIVLEGSAARNLSENDQNAIIAAALRWRFSHQEIKQLIEMAIDLTMWRQTPIGDFLKQPAASRNEALKGVRAEYQKITKKEKSYRGFQGSSDRSGVSHRLTTSLHRPKLGFGRCPVASPRTRCCNLLTLDVVEGCGFDCSYCSIRYFYTEDVIGFDENLPRALKNLDINPSLHYHIGTGQSSDSLMWGNKAGILDALIDFAWHHPNVILELKTKSDNIAHLLSADVPSNLIITWSLNSSTIIDNEEHFTASLERRLDAAAQIADAGSLVGFHLHPMVHYDSWRQEYGALLASLVQKFRPEDILMLSLGTLTFTKSVIRNLRHRAVKSRILQMPLVQSGGKLSYPRKIKKDLFTFAYESLRAWRNRVFFYLCMEEASLFSDVFGYEYRDNNEFESAMIDSYKEKIRKKHDIRLRGFKASSP